MRLSELKGMCLQSLNDCEEAAKLEFRPVAKWTCPGPLTTLILGL